MRFEYNGSLATPIIGEFIADQEEKAYEDPSLIKGCIRAFGAGALDGWIIGSVALTTGLAVYSIYDGIKGFFKKK